MGDAHRTEVISDPHMCQWGKHRLTVTHIHEAKSGVRRQKPLSAAQTGTHDPAAAAAAADGLNGHTGDSSHLPRCFIHCRRASDSPVAIPSNRDRTLMGLLLAAGIAGYNLGGSC